LAVAGRTPSTLTVGSDENIDRIELFPTDRSMAQQRNIKQQKKATGALAALSPDGSDRVLPAPAEWSLLRWLLIVAPFVVFVPAMYGYAGRQPIDRDAFIYAQVGKEMLAGQSLYQETWMDKPPLTFVLYAIPQIISPRSYQAIAFFCGLFVIAQGVLFAWVFRQTPAAVLTCLLFVTLYSFTLGCYAWPSSEHFSNLFVAGALVIALTISRSDRFSVGQCLAAGALACVAFHVRQNTVLCIVLPMLAVWQTAQPISDRIRALATIFAGGLLAWLPILAFVAVCGDLGMYFWTVFVYPQSFADAGTLGATGNLILFLLPTTPWLAGGLFLALIPFRQGRWLAPAMLAVGFLTCVITRRDFPHYWANAFPFVAVVLGMALESAARLDLRIARGLAIAMAIAVLPPVVSRMQSNYVAPTLYTIETLAEIANELTPPGGTLLVAGGRVTEGVQFASKLPPANMYEWMFMLQPTYTGILPKDFGQIRQEYLEHPPTMLVIWDELATEALAQPEPEFSTDEVRLIRALFQRHEYRRVAEEGGYSFVRLGSSFE